MGMARSQSHFSAGPLPPELASSLSLSDKCRIRDRSTIMARHMFADQGDRFADMQVNRGGGGVIRDCSTIMARHMFSDQGDRFADMQVNRGPQKAMEGHGGPWKAIEGHGRP